MKLFQNVGVEFTEIILYFTKPELSIFPPAIAPIDIASA